MTYPLLNEWNVTKGAHVLLQYADSVTSGILSQLTLTAIWLIIAFSIFNKQKMDRGEADFGMSCAVASFITMIFAILGLVVGFVSKYTFSIVLGVTIISIGIFFFSRD